MDGRRSDFELVLDQPKLTTVPLPQALRMKEKYVHLTSSENICFSMLLFYMCTYSNTFTFQEHLSSPPGFWGGSWCSIFSFLCSVLQIIVCLLSFNHCIACLSSEWHFSIFKLFFIMWFVHSMLFQRCQLQMHE